MYGHVDGPCFSTRAEITALAQAGAAEPAHVADLRDDHRAEDRADAGQGLDGAMAVMTVK